MTDICRVRRVKIHATLMMDLAWSDLEVSKNFTYATNLEYREWTRGTLIAIIPAPQEYILDDGLDEIDKLCLDVFDKIR